MPGNLGEHEDLNESLPIDVLPCSNGEFVPVPLSRTNRAGNRLAHDHASAFSKRKGTDRRTFLVSACGAASTLLWQIREPWVDRQHADAEAMLYVVGGEGTIRIDGRDTALVGRRGGRRVSARAGQGRQRDREHGALKLCPYDSGPGT